MGAHRSQSGHRQGCTRCCPEAAARRGAAQCGCTCGRRILLEDDKPIVSTYTSACVASGPNSSSGSYTLAFTATAALVPVRDSADPVPASEPIASAMTMRPLEREPLEAAQEEEAEGPPPVPGPSKAEARPPSGGRTRTAILMEAP